MLKQGIEKGAPDKGDVKEEKTELWDNTTCRMIGWFYINREGILAWNRREEDKVLYNYNAIVLPQLYQTGLLFRSNDYVGYHRVDRMKQNGLECGKHI